jgi:hypothetical protein
MDFSVSSLVAGFIFGVFGIYIFNFGRKQQRASLIVTGLAMMVYPYFISNVYLVWGIGAVLLVAAYKMMKL